MLQLSFPLPNPTNPLDNLYLVLITGMPFFRHNALQTYLGDNMKAHPSVFNVANMLSDPAQATDILEITHNLAAWFCSMSVNIRAVYVHAMVCISPRTLQSAATSLIRSNRIIGISLLILHWTLACTQKSTVLAVMYGCKP